MPPRKTSPRGVLVRRDGKTDKMLDARDAQA